MRVAEAIAAAAATLAAAHVGSPRVDAELLAGHVLGVRRGRLASIEEFTPEQAEAYLALVAQRALRVPLQYLTGTAPFRHLELAVGPGVFVPRPETELLVEWGLRWLGGRREAIVVDLCAGSGAIAAALASEAAGVRVIAVEVDPGAQAWLRTNVVHLGVEVVEGDAVAPTTLAGLDGRVDLILCNPPYVPEIGSAGIPLEVTEHDPHMAVFAGQDGLDVIRPLLPRVAALLRPGGAFGVEHHDTQAYVVPTLVTADERFRDVALHHDLAQRPRFTTATRA